MVLARNIYCENWEKTRTSVWGKRVNGFAVTIIQTAYVWIFPQQRWLFTQAWRILRQLGWSCQRPVGYLGTARGGEDPAVEEGTMAGD
jgi:hypothetical protein